MNWLRTITTASKIAFQSKGYLGVLFLSWLAVLTLFLGLSRSSVIAYMLLNPQFSALTKLTFLWDIYRNFFAYLFSPLVFTAFLFTVLAALNITLLMYMARAMERRASAKGSLGAAGAVIASHVLSCGSSLLAPFFSALAGSSAYNDPTRLQIAGLFGLTLNLVGLILITRSTTSVARHIASMRPVTPEYFAYLAPSDPV